MTKSNFVISVLQVQLLYTGLVYLGKKDRKLLFHRDVCCINKWIKYLMQIFYGCDNNHNLDVKNISFLENNTYFKNRYIQ